MAKKELCKEWSATSIGRQAKFFIHGPNNNLTQFAMGLNRPDIRILVGLLTGHITLNRHLTIMGVCTDPICEARGEEEETSLHFLGQCSARMQLRFSALGAYLLNLAELQNCKLAKLLKFAKSSKRLL